MTLLEWIKKNAVEGADITEAEGLIKDLDPLKNIQTKDEALAFMERNQVFKSALDAETSRRADKAVDKFKEKNLPEIIKEREEAVRKEVNPEETPEQKRIRELEEKLANSDKEKQQNALKAELRQKAKEIAEKKGVPYDPLRAERLFIYGEDAESVLNDEIDYIGQTIEKQLSDKLKSKYVGKTPSAGGVEPTGIDEQIAAAKKSGNLFEASKLMVQKSQQEKTN